MGANGIPKVEAMERKSADAKSLDGITPTHIDSGPRTPGELGELDSLREGVDFGKLDLYASFNIERERRRWISLPTALCGVVKVEQWQPRGVRWNFLFPIYSPANPKIYKRFAEKGTTRVAGRDVGGCTRKGIPRRSLIGALDQLHSVCPVGKVRCGTKRANRVGYFS